jgi:hypothetical protein
MPQHRTTNYSTLPDITDNIHTSALKVFIEDAHRSQWAMITTSSGKRSAAKSCTYKSSCTWQTTKPAHAAQPLTKMQAAKPPPMLLLVQQVREPYLPPKGIQTLRHGMDPTLR